MAARLFYRGHDSLKAPIPWLPSTSGRHEAIRHEATRQTTAGEQHTVALLWLIQINARPLAQSQVGPSRTYVVPASRAPGG